MADIDDLRHIASLHRAVLGVTDLSPFPQVAQAMQGRVSDGTAARLGFTYRDIETATDPSRSFPWAKSIVVIAAGYLLDGDGPSGSRSVARFADGDRYRSLTSTLDAVAGHLVELGYRGEVVFDDAALVDRALAERAGVGWWGKSTMILTPGHGPWVLIGSVVTNADLPRDKPMERTCGTCDACIPACPTGAIVAPGVLDARRCLAALFQSRGDIPRPLRRAAGGRIYGCDECLTACPPGSRHLASYVSAADHLTPEAVLEMSDTALESVFGHWFVPGRQMRFLRRNALVALGNVGGGDAVGVAIGYVGHRDAMLRRHAFWALGSVDPEVAVVIGREIERGENDAGMLAEIEALTVSQR